MSAPVPLGCAENPNYAERKKGRAENSVIHNPGNACAKERQGGEQSKVARLGVHSCSRLERGSDGAALPCARVDGLEPMKNHGPPRQVGRPSFWRPSRALPDPEKPCRGAMPSRPRPVGGVNELVKYADIDVRSRRANNLDMTIVEITGGMLRAARVPVDLSFEDLAGSHVDELPIQRVERERLRRACRRHHARQHHECRRRAGRLAMNVDAPFGYHEDRTPTPGYAATREDAMAAFAKSWRREQ